MKLHLHSIVAAITNSSTEIYTWVSNNAISTAKKHVEAFLKLLDIEEKFDDLFTVEVVVETEPGDDDPEDAKAETIVLKTNEEIKALNDKLSNSGWKSDWGIPSYDKYSVVVKSKKTGNTIDLSEISSVIARQAVENR